MFGESLSESPRVPSPWDSLISTPPSPALHPANIPKLVPEAEEGNVEYKLQLLSPSPARFERLVTQLKWRLLEGRGQAYYELGVADSGALVGLPRADLEQSLETLEMMAGEIGASVIVVKEIEVPAAMAGLAGSETDRWNGKRRKKRSALLHSASGGDSATSTTDPDTGSFSATDVTDFDDDLTTEVYGNRAFHLRTNTTRLLTLEDSLALFLIDSESNLNADSTTVSLNSTFSADLEIASVFKPRPMRKRVYHAHTGSTLVIPSPPRFKSAKHGPGTKPKTHQGHQHLQMSHNTNVTSAVTLDEELERHCAEALDKAGKRRQARDRRRDEKRRALLTHTGHDHRESVEDDTFADNDVPAQDINVPPDAVVDADLVSGLASLHVSVAAASFSEPPLLIPTDTIPDTRHQEEDDDDADIFVNRSASTSTGVAVSSTNTRLIVEAVVVRKLSLEEACLDFGGFSLM